MSHRFPGSAQRDSSLDTIDVSSMSRTFTSYSIAIVFLLRNMHDAPSFVPVVFALPFYFEFQLILSMNQEEDRDPPDSFQVRPSARLIGVLPAIR